MLLNWTELGNSNFKSNFTKKKLFLKLNVNFCATAFAEVGGYEALLDKYHESEAAPEYTAYEWDPVTNTNKYVLFFAKVILGHS